MNGLVKRIYMTTVSIYVAMNGWTHYAHYVDIQFR